MRNIVIAGGPSIHSEFIKNIIAEDDFVICADSGIDYASEVGIIPNKVVGDLDSISEEGKAYIKAKNIPLELFPVEKDMTDAELALDGLDYSNDTILISSLVGRIDHILGNVNLVARLRKEGKHVQMTDGVSHFIPMYGDDYIRISGIKNPESFTVSLVPFEPSKKVAGVKTSGLYYELDGKDIAWGETLTISNKLKSGCDSFEVTIKDGLLGVFIVPTE